MKSSCTRYINSFYWILFIAIAIIFFIIQNTFYDPNSYRNYSINALDEEAYIVHEDGTKEKTYVKNNCYVYKDAQANKISTIEITLPEIKDDDESLNLLSNEQGINIYIDGELRKAYEDTDYHILEKHNSSNIINVGLQKEDSYKTVRIEYYTNLRGYAKILCCAFVGTEMNFLCWVLYRAVWQLICGIILFGLGCLLIAIGCYFKILGRDDRGLAPLGLFSLLMAAWLFFRCNLRGFYLNHIGSAESFSFFVLMLAPVPVIMFFNQLLKYKYEKIYSIATVILILNLAISGTIELAGAGNAIELGWVIQLLIGLVYILCLCTTWLYIKENKLENGSFVIVGLIGFIVSSAAEEVSRLYYHEQFVGRFIGTGMLFFLLMIAYSAIKNLIYQEQQLKDAVLKNGFKSAFLANMSHEIRTPINTILGMDEMILRECDDQEIRHYASNISNAGKTLLLIINDILDFSKIEAGKMELASKRYNLVKVLLDIIDAASLRAIEKSLVFKYNVNEEIPALLLGDETKIRQILNNIISNAIKYTKEGSVIFEVDYKPADEKQVELIFRVTDTGIGIKEEDKDRLFDSFVRLEENKNRNIEGTGLGMAITKQLVEMLEGKIEIDSTYGVGSSFCVTFKQKVVDDTPVGNISKHRRLYVSNKKYVEEYSAKDLRILVVDDNEMNVEVIKGLLKNTSALIDSADSGKECLAKCQNKNYDLIFLDHMMPEMDGIETLQRLRKLDGQNKEVPVVALTANAVLGARQEYMEAGFADYLSKPVEYKNLVQMIEKFVPKKFTHMNGKPAKSKKDTSFLEGNGINVQDALKYSGDDLEQYFKLLEMFISDRSKEKREQLKKAYEEENWNDYTIYVHSLKNTARTIGANTLADFSFEHEKAAKAKNTEFILKNFDKLILDWTNAMDIVETALGEKNKLQYKATDRDNPEKKAFINKKALLDEIINAIDNFKKNEATAKIDKALQMEWDAKDQEKLEETKRLMLAYEYELALEIIRSIHE